MISSNFSARVPEAKIFAPASLNFLTIEFPIPPEAPVIIIFLPFEIIHIFKFFMSSSLFIASIFTSLLILLIKPDKTFPGPISIK